MPMKPLILNFGTTKGVFVMPWDAAAKLEPHPLAQIFPALHPNDMDTLTSDILHQGQIHAVVLYENKILDGVHRAAACKAHMLDLKCIRFEDLNYRGTPYELVLSENIERRHMDDHARALAGASVLDFYRRQSAQAEAGKLGGKLGGRGHKKTLGANLPQGFNAPKRAPRLREQIIASQHVTRAVAEKAIDIAKHAPELLRAAMQDQTAFESAAEEAKRRRKEKRQSKLAAAPKAKKPWREATALEAALRAVQRHFNQAPAPRRRDFIQKFIGRLHEIH